MKVEVTIQEFDLFLVQKGISFQGVVIGATALALLGVISRETRDCDILDPEIPESVKSAAKEFAAKQTKAGFILREDWLNNGPESLKKHLPSGWLKRCKPLFSGKALRLSCLGREDLLLTKLYAYCDRGQDLQDCLDLKPTPSELLRSMDWVKAQDANTDWPKHVELEFKKLGGKLGHGI